MSKSIAELRTDSRATLPERSYQLCLAGDLIAEMQKLQNERAELSIENSRSISGDGEAKPPTRLGEHPMESEALREVNERLAALWDEMAEYTGDLRLRAIASGDWTTWVDEHPAREENARDLEVTFGGCNADDLIAELGRFAVRWNGEDMRPDEWREVILPRVSFADLKAIAQTVYAMHEIGVDLPKLRLASRGDQQSATD